MAEGGDHRHVELDEVQSGTNELMEEPVVQEDEEPSTQTLCRSQRVSRPPKCLYLIQDKSLDVLLVEETDPFTDMESILDIDSVKWQDAINMRWTQCMRIKFGTWFRFPKELFLSVVNGFTRGSEGPMESLKPLSPDW